MRRFIWVLLALIGAPLLAGSAGEVSLPLADYLDLVTAAELAEKTAAERQRAAEAPVHQVTAMDLDATFARGVVTMRTTFEVELRGSPLAPVALAVAGQASSAIITPDDRGAALHRDRSGQIILVAPIAGRYQVIVSSEANLDRRQGRLVLPATASPVSTARLDVPVDLDWSSDSAVPIGEQVADSRRVLRFALDRDRPHTVVLRPKVDAALADQLLLRTAVVTVAEVTRDHLRRRDVVLYDVLRGALPDLELSLPPGFELDRTDTDEGQAISRPDEDTLVIPRQEMLRGRGHVVLTARPSASSRSMSLAPVSPAAPPTARFLVLAPQIAARAVPRPASAWQRIDLEDLPDQLADEIAALRPSAAWRLVDSTVAVRLDVEPLEAAEKAGAVVLKRQTTSVLTLDGTLVHRDRLEVEHAGSSLALALPPGARLWSTWVGGAAVRPVARGDSLLVPLAYSADGRAQVEVVTMVPQALPTGRGELALTLPKVALPVFDHDWQLLLPENKRYRLTTSTLSAAPLPRSRPVRSIGLAPTSLVASMPAATDGLVGVVTDMQGNALPGVTVEATTASGDSRNAFTDAQGHFAFADLPPGNLALIAHLDGFSTVEYPRVNVRAGHVTTVEVTLSAAVEETLTVSAGSPGSYPGGALERYSGSFGKKAAPPVSGIDRQARQRAFQDAVGHLRQQLTRGVKPLAIELPASGKLLHLSGALPPPEVRAVLDVRPSRKPR